MSQIMYCIEIKQSIDDDDYIQISLSDKDGFCMSYSGFGTWAALTLLDEHSIDVRGTE